MSTHLYDACDKYTDTVADPKILKGGQNTIYQLRPPHLSQMRTTKYMPFTRKKSSFLKKHDPTGGGGRPLPLNPPLHIYGTRRKKPLSYLNRVIFGVTESPSCEGAWVSAL